MSEPNFKMLLLNLLARVHRDGGHYTVRHGLEQACIDAHEKVAGAYAENDVLKARVAELEEEIDNWQQSAWERSERD